MDLSNGIACFKNSHIQKRDNFEAYKNHLTSDSIISLVLSFLLNLLLAKQK